ncbi:serine/threonine-protein kinase [Sphaerisporangium sp. B11E5]|uniref:serine/threonine-protein kinase n=1 Tax=Sphaerisporangium sp. B11E5 TaxID=3153563 RepID=UPI00325D7AAA
MTVPRVLGFRGPERIGDYQISALLGEGGQGAVYLGRSPDGARVAIKVLHPRFADDPEPRRRFLREAEVAASVAAFCTARVLGTGIAGDQPYIVSEYVPGPSLDQLVRTDGPRTGSGLERLAVSTLTALSSIHRGGIVHRDFKPANVILGPEGPVVIDFGIARALDHMSHNTHLVGTPAYMSPEQLTDHPLTPASDMFSWAGTMVFAATGRAPFPATFIPAILAAVLYGEPDLTGVPEPLRRLVAACLVKDPAERPRADRLLHDLTSGDTVNLRPAGRHSAERRRTSHLAAPPRPARTLVDPSATPAPDPHPTSAHPTSAHPAPAHPAPAHPTSANPPAPGQAHTTRDPVPDGRTTSLARPGRRRGGRGRGPLYAAAAVAAALVVTGALLVPSWFGAAPPGASLDLGYFPRLDVADRFTADTSTQYTSHQPNRAETLPERKVGGGKYAVTAPVPFFSMVTGPGMPSSGQVVSIVTAGRFAGTGGPEDSVFVGWVKNGGSYVTAWYNNTRKDTGMDIRQDGGFLGTPSAIPLTLKPGDRLALVLSGDTLSSYAETGGTWRRLRTTSVAPFLSTPEDRRQYRYGFGLRGTRGTMSIAGAEGRGTAE